MGNQPSTYKKRARRKNILHGQQKQHEKSLTEIELPKDPIKLTGFGTKVTDRVDVPCVPVTDETTGHGPCSPAAAPCANELTSPCSPEDDKFVGSCSQAADRHVGSSMEGSQNISEAEVEECPPTPCPAFYVNNGPDRPHKVQSSISYGDDEDAGVYAIIPTLSNTNIKEPYGASMDNGIPPCGYGNPECFIRGGLQRSSQQTNSSTADSAYTASTNNSCHNCSDVYFCLNCACTRTQNIEYMTDVYRRTLQRDVRVMDILNDIHCVDDLRKEEILKKSKESRQEAIGMLLESIRCSNEEGKWQNFIEALDRSGYNFLVKLLKGETENDQEKNKKLLSLISRQLINNIHVDDCLDKLYEEELLTIRDKEEIEAELKNYGPIAAASKMFSIVPTRSHEWDKRLSGVLEKCGLNNFAKLFDISQESMKTQDADQTEPKKRICSHSKHHYETICGRRYSSRQASQHYDRTADTCMSTETNRAVTEVDAHVQTIKEITELHVSAVKELQNSQINEFKQLKYAGDVMKSYINQLHEADTVFQREMSSALQAQKACIEANQRELVELKQKIGDIEAIELENQRKLVELKQNIGDIKSSSPPEACRQSVHNIQNDSGFSAGSGSVLVDDFLENHINSGFGNLHGINEEVNIKL